MNAYWVLLLALFVAQANSVHVPTGVWIALVVIMFIKSTAILLTIIKENK